MKRFFRKVHFRLARRGKKESIYGEAESPSVLEELPVEVKQDIASFLPVCDLVKLSETCQRINRDLDVVVLSMPLSDRASQSKAFRTDNTPQCFAVVIPNQEESHSHSTTFSFHVMNDRYIEGSICVVEQDLPANQSRDNLRRLGLSHGESVAETTLMGSLNGDEHLSFVPKSGKFYQLWVNSSSMLHISNMMLHHVGLATKPSPHVGFQFEVRPPVSSFAVR